MGSQRLPLQIRRRLFAGAATQSRFRIFPIQFRNEARTNFRGADRFAFVSVGAITKTFRVHRANHTDDTFGPFRFALRQESEMRDFRCSKQHRRRIRARRRARAATDARRRFHRKIDIMLWNRS